MAITAQGRITDLSRRKEREGIFASLKKIDCVPEYHQGHLAVYAVETPSAYNQDEEWDGSIFRHPQRPLVLYNHALFVEAALGLDNKRLFKVRDETTLTSPDHPLEPITFNTGNGDWYVMEHPIPSDRDVD